MPFCTECGHQNPDDARFCSQCGTPLVAAAGGAGGVRTPTRPPRRSRFGAPSKEAEHREERSLNDADAAAVDALPAGQRPAGRAARSERRAAASCSTPTWSPPAATRTATSSSTTSPSPAGTPSSAATADGFAVADVGSLNGTYVNRDRIDEVALQGGDEVQIGKYRLVFFASHAGAGSAR